MSRKKSLIVCVGERLSAIVKKGEVTPRYYNPCDLFDEVHFFTLKSDNIDFDAMKPAIGRASMQVHTFRAGQELFVKTLGFRPFLMEKWAKAAVKEASFIGPAVIRCHGTGVHSYLASRIKTGTGTPYVVSLHCSTHCKSIRDAMGTVEKLADFALRNVQLESLNNANVVVPVYKGILKTLDWLGASPRRIEVIPNAVNHDNIAPKKNYELSGKFKALHVGRFIHGKGVENVLNALTQVPEASLTLIGDGPERKNAVALASNLGISDRVEFIRSMSNGEICKSLGKYDAYLYFGTFSGISKGTIEALLSGLPVIANRQEEIVEEHEGGHIFLVDPLPESYASALKGLAASRGERERLGRAGLTYANTVFSKDATEGRMAALYRELAGDALA